MLNEHETRARDEHATCFKRRACDVSPSLDGRRRSVLAVSYRGGAPLTSPIGDPEPGTGVHLEVQ